MFQLIHVTKEFIVKTLQPTAVQKHRHVMQIAQRKEIDENTAFWNWEDKKCPDKVRGYWEKLIGKFVYVDIDRSVPKVLHIYEEMSFEKLLFMRRSFGLIPTEGN
jgi:hypothetical protein